MYIKADELVKGFGRNFAGETKEYKVLGNIGIAKYPEHWKSFKELFEMQIKQYIWLKKRGKIIIVFLKKYNRTINKIIYLF